MSATTILRPPVGAIEQLTDDLRRDIETGKYRPGVRIPRFRELALEHDVSIPSVQCAVRQLKAEGLLTAIPGSGTYVNRAQPRAGRARSTVRIIYNDLPAKRVVNNMFRMVLGRFHERHPEISIDFAPKPQELLSSREHLILPELFKRHSVSAMLMGSDFISDLAYHRQIAEVGGLADRWIRPADLVGAVRDTGVWAGGVYGIPFVLGLPVLLVYRPAFRRLLGGAALERAFASWEALRELRGSATGKKGGVGICCEGGDHIFYLWQHILAQRGTGPFGREPSVKPALIGSAGASALSFIRELLRTGTLSVEPGDPAEILARFVGGTHPAFFSASPGVLLSLLRARGIPDADVAVLPLPLVTGGKQIQFVTSHAWVFSPYLSKKGLESAVRLAVHLAGSETHSSYHQRLAGLFPDRRYWLPLGKDLVGWDGLTPGVQGHWKEYVKTWLPKAAAKPAAPFWTLAVFEDDLGKLAENPALDVNEMLPSTARKRH